MMQTTWQATRAQILERDGHKCTQCSATENLEVHHKIPFADGGKDEPENLITLCADCHKKIPRQNNRKYPHLTNSNISVVKKLGRYSIGLKTRIPRWVVEKTKIKEGDYLLWNIEETKEGIFLTAFVATEYLKQTHPRSFGAEVKKA